MKTPSVLLWMVLAIAFVTALAYWDEERESAAALNDFAHEQAALAKGVSSALAVRLSATQGDAVVIARELARTNTLSGGTGAFHVSVRPKTALPAQTPEDGQTFQLGFPFDEQKQIDVVLQTTALLASIKSVEEPGAVRVLVHRPSRLGFVTTAGEILRAQEIDAALEGAAPWVRLSRASAAQLGLPARTAVAGLSTIDAGPFGKWGVAVVATAQRERDRELHAQWRLVLGVVVASGLVLVFGGLALRNQRKELELGRDLAIAERDERLVRADKLATMGALATGIAHEVSTPLGVIMGHAEQLLPRLEADERSKRALEVISEQAERIGRIVREFLSLARGNSPALEHVDPAALAKNALDLVLHRFEKAGVRVRSNIAPRLPRVACEPRLFEQVLVNLLLNACDACDPGGSAELSVCTDGDRVAFVVIDDGAGITAEAAARATEPFFTTKPEGQGTGLGLAIANEIVKHHCGTLRIDPRSAISGSSRPSSGTRACVEIPAVARTHA